jgi:hypothetical protein
VGLQRMDGKPLLEAFLFFSFSNLQIMDLSNLEQSLLEEIGDWLDKESVVFEQNVRGFYDPMPRETSDLHIKMAEAAMKVYAENIAVSQNPIFS